MTYRLLTGATGLLGRYLLRDLVRQGEPVAVLVRPSRLETPEQRVDQILTHWEEQWGRSLPRPVVLSGDITKPLLGLDRGGMAWARRHCGRVLHSAASLSFYEEDGEPYRSNVEGVRNVLEFCRAAGVRVLEHVSTSYVCGLRTGTVLESELDLGQTLANDYEKSKVAAEKLVRTAEHLDAFHIFRPSIIVGDHRTGYTSTFHGFYAPLRIAYALLSMIDFDELFEVDYLGLLGLSGQERKNLVPVDWVSDAMVTILRRRAPANETFALVSPHPVTVARILRVFEEIVRRRGRPSPHSGTASGEAAGAAAQDAAGAEMFQKAYLGQIATYRSYWRDDPEFDSAATRAALPDRPCPELTDQTLRRLCEYAVDARFGWPRRLAPPLAFSVGQWLRGRLGADPRDADPSGNGTPPQEVLGLTVTGSGGGCWTILRDKRGGLCCGEGLGRPGTEVRMNSCTFREMVEGVTTLKQAVRQARVTVFGDPAGLASLEALVDGSPLRPAGGPHTAGEGAQDRSAQAIISE